MPHSRHPISDQDFSSLIVGEPLRLAACAASASASAQPSTTASAASVAITGTGYTYTVPEGWGAPASGAIPTVDSVAGDLNPAGSNVDVIVDATGVVTADQVEAAAPNELQTAGATEIALGVRVNVAGSDSANVTAVLLIGDQSNRFHQYYVSNETQTYVVTFSFDVATSDADAGTIIDPILASWTWA